MVNSIQTFVIESRILAEHGHADGGAPAALTSRWLRFQSEQVQVIVLNGIKKSCFWARFFLSHYFIREEI